MAAGADERKWRQGVRASGIGYFFDGPVHELMDLPDDAGLYHFTVGSPLADARLATRAICHNFKTSVGESKRMWQPR